METGVNAICRRALHLRACSEARLRSIRTYSPLVAGVYRGRRSTSWRSAPLIVRRGKLPGQQAAQEDRRPWSRLRRIGARFDLLLEEALTEAELAAYRRGQQCEILYDGEARDDEGLPDGDRL